MKQPSLLLPHRRGPARAFGAAPLALVLLALAAMAVTGVGSPPAAAQERPAAEASETAAGDAPALVIEEGSVARKQVVALGRDIRIAGRADTDVAALNGSVEVSGEVGGDVVVLGGDVRVASTARVAGDVYVLGGTLTAAPGADISGRSVAYPDASAATLALLEAPTLGYDAASPLVLGAKLALMTAWLALVLVFFAASGRQVLATSESVYREPIRCFWTGLTGVLAFLLTALFFSLFASQLVGIPMILLVVFFALIAKLWGMVAVFHAFGRLVTRRLAGRRFTPLNTATTGLLVLGGIKFLPWVGLLVWNVATFIGVGAALVTKLGREEPWFDFSGTPPRRPAPLQPSPSDRSSGDGSEGGLPPADRARLSRGSF